MKAKKILTAITILIYSVVTYAQAENIVSENKLKTEVNKFVSLIIKNYPKDANLLKTRLAYKDYLWIIEVHSNDAFLYLGEKKDGNKILFTSVSTRNSHEGGIPADIWDDGANGPDKKDVLDNDNGINGLMNNSEKISFVQTYYNNIIFFEKILKLK